VGRAAHWALPGLIVPREINMSEKVSAFWPVQVGQFKYLFFVVNWSDFSTGITESLERNLEALGEGIGVQGLVVQAYKGARLETYQEVMGKEGWPYDVRARFESEQYPFMLIIDTNFKQFDPQENKWAAVWFSDFIEEKDSIPKTFAALVKKIRHGENLFDYFKGLNAKKAAKGLIGYFQIKPSVFGISVDVKALLSDLGTYFQRKLPKAE
jgi:hypothetical protein